MTQNQNPDPWEQADNAKPRDFEYYGKVQADCWFGFFPGNKAKPIPFDPTIHPVDKRTAMIEIQIIPIAEQNVTFDVRQSYTDFSPDWTKITLPSIKTLGMDGLRALNNHWIRVAMVDGKREKKDQDGNKTGEFYKTFKFVEVFADEAACVHAYAGAGPASTETEPQVEAAPANNEKDTALKFAEVIVRGCVKGETDIQVIQNKIAAQIANMPMIAKHFTASSPEILTLIVEAMK